MLVSFNMSNFKSFAKEASVSLQAHKAEKTLGAAVVRVGNLDLPILTAAAIYGSNASGKSNFLLGLSFVHDAVVFSQAKWAQDDLIPVDPTIDNAEEPSRFEIEFVSPGGVLFRYGFEAYRTHFRSEWLYSYPKGKERRLFTRETAAVDGEMVTTWDPGPTLSGDARGHASSFSRVRHNSLLLAAFAQDNQADASEVRSWFRYFSVRMNDGPTVLHRGFTSKMANDYGYYKKLLLPLLKIADSNIVDVEFVAADKSGAIPTYLAEAPKEIQEFFQENMKYEVYFISNVNGTLYRIDYSKQSRGVKRLYIIAHELLNSLMNGGVIAIDELESSMHPQVASQLLAIYQNPMTNPHGAQLIFTTHETRLLNLKHLRRDQIWFVEKESGCSSLYSLLSFSPRKDENFEAGYLRGKYGALPQTAIDPDWIEGLKDRERYAAEEIAE